MLFKCFNYNSFSSLSIAISIVKQYPICHDFIPIAKDTRIIYFKLGTIRISVKLVMERNT